MKSPHVLPISGSRRANEARAMERGRQLFDVSLSSIGWRRGPGRGGATPLSGSLRTRSPRGESETPRLPDFYNQSCFEKALTFIFVSLLTSAATGLAAEHDPRMVAPSNAVSGRLPGIAPTPARDAARAFRG